MYTIEELNVKLLSELKELAEKIKLDNFKKLAKKELVYKILDFQSKKTWSILISFEVDFYQLLTSNIQINELYSN